MFSKIVSSQQESNTALRVGRAKRHSGDRTAPTLALPKHLELKP